jgi:hypothetical protein
VLSAVFLTTEITRWSKLYRYSNRPPGRPWVLATGSSTTMFVGFMRGAIVAGSGLRGPVTVADPCLDMQQHGGITPLL